MVISLWKDGEATQIDERPHLTLLASGVLNEGASA